MISPTNVRKPSRIRTRSMSRHAAMTVHATRMAPTSPMTCLIASVSSIAEKSATSVQPSSRTGQISWRANGKGDCPSARRRTTIRTAGGEHGGLGHLDAEDTRASEGQSRYDDQRRDDRIDHHGDDRERDERDSDHHERAPLLERRRDERQGKAQRSRADAYRNPQRDRPQPHERGGSRCMSDRLDHTHCVCSFSSGPPCGAPCLRRGVSGRAARARHARRPLAPSRTPWAPRHCRLASRCATSIPTRRANCALAGGRSGEVLPEEVRTVDDHEPTEKPGIVRAEAELPVLDDDLGCVADPSEPGEAIREVLVLRERVAGQLLVEADRHGGFPARAHEAALHELDVARPLEIPQVAGVAVPGESALRPRPRRDRRSGERGPRRR